MLRALDSASCDITHETGGTICYGHSILRLVISHTRQGIRFVTDIGFCGCDITHETGGTLYCGHWVLCLVIFHMRPGLRFNTGVGFCVL